MNMMMQVITALIPVLALDDEILVLDESSKRMSSTAEMTSCNSLLVSPYNLRKQKSTDTLTPNPKKFDSSCELKLVMHILMNSTTTVLSTTADCSTNSDNSQL